MRTIGVMVCSLVTACAQIGESGPGTGDDDDTGPDAGMGSTAACETKTTDVMIASSADFTSLPQGCWDLDATLRVSGTGITSLGQLGGLRKVKELRIETTGLTSFAPTSQIEVTGKLQISSNTSLTTISNIKPLDTVTAIQIDGNSALTSLGSLTAITKVTGSVTIRNNAQLTTLDLKNVATIDGELVIADNARVTTLALGNLESVASLTIRNNDAMTSLGAMPRLRAVHGTLTIDGNALITSLANTIPTGVVVDAGVAVTNHPALTELGNVKRLGQVTGSAVFGGNPQLHWHEIYEVDCCVRTSGFSWDDNSPSCNQTMDSYNPSCMTGGNCPHQLYY